MVDLHRGSDDDFVNTLVCRGNVLIAALVDVQVIHSVEIFVALLSNLYLTHFYRSVCLATLKDLTVKYVLEVSDQFKKPLIGGQVVIPCIEG